jgi:polysaccharide pyruvyl transferase WcaK-like protein
MLACHSLLQRHYPANEIAFVFSSHPSEAERAYVRRLLPGINLIRFESEAGAEVVVWGGGTQFYSFPKTRTASPFYRKALAGLLDPAKTYNYFLKRAFGGKFNSRQRFAALGVGVGPFVPGSAEEGYTRNLFSKMDFASVRDDDSMSLCRAWEVSAARQHADLCFLPGAWWPSKPTPAAAPSTSRRVGIIVRDWPHDSAGGAYEQPLASVAESLRERGYTVTYILFRHGGDRGWRTSLEERGESILAWNPEQQTIAQFLAMLSQFDLLLTARYHGALFGALLGIPVVCVEIEPKLKLVSELLTVPLWARPFDADKCVTLIDQTFQEWPQVRTRMSRVVDAQRELASRMTTEFLEFLAHGQKPVAKVAEQALA